MLQHQYKIQNFQFEDYQPSEYLLQQLYQYQLQAKSQLFYISKLLQKAIKSFKLTIQSQQLQQLTTLRYYWNHILQQTKINKIQSYRKYKTLTQMIKISQHHVLYMNKLKKSLIFRTNKLLGTHFDKLVRQTKISKLLTKLTKYRLQNSKKIFIFHLKSYHQSYKQVKIQNQILGDFHKQHLIKISFFSWKITNKIVKLEIIRKKKYLPILIYKTKSIIIRQASTPFNHWKKKRFLIGFLSFKYNWIQHQIANKLNKTLRKQIFNSWKEFSLKNKQLENIQKQYQDLLDNYLNRKQYIKKMYSFRIWKNYYHHRINNRNEDEIIKQYAQIKQKDILLKKYFYHLKIYRKYGIGRRYHENKLKNKTIEAFKVIIIKSSNQWIQVNNFVQNRQLRKYFKSIIQFNNQQDKIIKKFQLKRLFNLFTFGLSKIYYHKQQLANNYNKHNLLFKSVYALKKQVQFQKKSNYAIIKINVLLNLKRWRVSHKLKAFLETKKEWKLMRINRKIKPKDNPYLEIAKASNYSYSPSKYIQLSFSDWDSQTDNK